MKINWIEEGTLNVHPNNVVIEADTAGFENLASLLRAFAETPGRAVMHVDLMGPTPLSSGGPLILMKI